ncbi:Histone-lysine N-methyltransferase, H3 lysine-36 specific [Neolecta irregularis DAH-3]|uniref:Histone-lysine N-methyltransferase, H3 lysine-36 specific n=1 Tax=Neolecta irregularis (strain DAH-3) TaxID=1198029 RepID=A0A1U7LII7_NEOID|nr:Histone-lysine N-methyltransferase, H3 lysine-36 specific [Neolecta irregularis DAH-3]|eukprot:OLL22465.1 Histone-lysine N-methyltransferase, H3 lysine-36 specific [Neolecta irregularis DAH-3]
MSKQDTLDTGKITNNAPDHLDDPINRPPENGIAFENMKNIKQEAAFGLEKGNLDPLNLQKPSDHCSVVSESNDIRGNCQKMEAMDFGLLECTIPSSADVKLEPLAIEEQLPTTLSGRESVPDSPGSTSPTCENSESDKEPQYSKKNLIQAPSQLFKDLPSAKVEASQTFMEITKCNYINKSMGETNQHESMGCDCLPEWDGERNLSCGEDSDCINRMTSMECTEDDCNCGEGCQNQRFQKGEYADVDVIKTQLKGHGLRTNSDLPKGLFIYEYVGDVIHDKEFRRRMIRYDEEGIKHFYFMMLQKGEFIDATRRGGLGRFINHSCSPNCYVDKWVVGTKLRMGIFAKRNIQAGEELTFDYNVDRYGAQAQPCYCGEPDCIGFIGGKTQTEAKSKMPDNVRAALGLEEDDEWDWETTTVKKRRKSKRSGEDDEYINIQPREADEKGVTKIMSTLMQCKEQWMINKLLLRLQVCVHRRVMKMHGYQILGTVLGDWKEDDVIPATILEVLLKWPRLTRNKISSSKIEDIVRELTERENENVKTMAQTLLQEWSSLEMAYRIPKKRREIVDTQESTDTAESVDAQDEAKLSSTSKITFINRQRWAGPLQNQPTFYVPRIQFKSQEEAHKTEKMDLQKIIDAANKQLAAKAALAKVEEEAMEKQKPRKEQKSKKDKEKKEKKSDNTEAEKSKRKNKDPEILEKQLTKLFAKFVPNVIAKYSEQFEKEDLKKRAKEIR